MIKSLQRTSPSCIRRTFGMRHELVQLVRSHSSIPDECAPVRIGNEPLQISKERVKEITWYACGPTVYDDAHLGHARTYVTTDIIRRILENFFQVPVRFAMGITDIDDKIIARCKSMNILSRDGVKSFTEKMEREFVADLDALGVERPDAILRVTEHIPDIIHFVDTLIKAGYAYVSKDGVYFEFAKLPGDHQYDRFGNLGNSKTTVGNEAAVSNPMNPSEADDLGGSSVTHDKRDSRDFALWKLHAATDKSTEQVGWESPWGRGRPGWHIECSSMTYRYFGTRLDIHSGGIDLQFPHHTNEIAQSECHHRAIAETKEKTTANCCYNPQHPWVQHWIHTGHIHIAGRKMSKSLKNFISIRDYFKMGLTSNPGDDFRIFCLQNKYDSLITYSDDRIADAATIREKISTFLSMVERIHSKQQSSLSSLHMENPSESAKDLTSKLFSVQGTIYKKLADDFHTPAVLQEVLDLISAGNIYGNRLLQQYSSISTLTENKITVDPIEPLLSVDRYLRKLLSTFGLQFVEKTNASLVNSDVADSQKLLQLLVQLRTTVRSVAVTGMKSSKDRQKKTMADASQPSVDVEKELKKLCQDILQATDKTRLDAEKELNLKLDDSYGSETVIRKK